MRQNRRERDICNDRMDQRLTAEQTTNYAKKKHRSRMEVKTRLSRSTMGTINANHFFKNHECTDSFCKSNQLTNFFFALSGMG